MGARGLRDSGTEGPRKPDQSGRLSPAAPPSTPRLPRRAVRGRRRPGPHAAGARRSRRAPGRRRLPAPLPLGAGSLARGRAERREGGRCLTAVGRRRTVAAESRRLVQGGSGGGREWEGESGRCGWAPPLPCRAAGLGGASCSLARRGGQRVCAAHGVPRCAPQGAAGLPTPVPRPRLALAPRYALNPVQTRGGPEAPGLRSEGTSGTLSPHPASSFHSRRNRGSEW